ncbi:MAG TPA: 3'(2'),5'-bisphosphate nucleotidase CysQ [Egibacteraceae bacterium]|nr:3'(2'),5'-bisphosphate nucleotidase CysQ [Egibacteraceae bacterium]
MIEHAQAARIADAAGRLLLALRQRLGAHGVTVDGLRDEADRRSHRLIVDALVAAFPDDAVLSEEGKDDPVRLGARRLWIVDPLDGTREFAEPGRTDWAVHVAFLADGRLQAGAVALPARSLLLSTAAPPVLAPRPPATPLRLAVSRTRPPDVTEAIRSALGAELVPMGSAGAKTMAVVRGEVDVYAHAGGQYEWDSAAPVAVAGAAGVHVSRLDGAPLRYNQPDPWLPDLLVCRPELAGTVMAAAAHG